MFLYRQTDLIMNKEIRNSLISLYGVGYYKAILISSKIGFSYPYNLNLLNIYNFNVLIFVLDNLTWLENRIKREIDLNIKRLIEIQTLKGARHKDRLPVYGQRTRTNARTQKRKRFRIK